MLSVVGPLKLWPEFIIFYRLNRPHILPESNRACWRHVQDKEHGWAWTVIWEELKVTQAPSGTAFVPATSQWNIFPYSAIYSPPKSAIWWKMVIPCHQSMPCFVNFHICTLQRENYRLAFIDQLIDFFRGGHILQYISMFQTVIWGELRMTPSWQSSSIHPPLPAISHGLVWHGMVQYGMVWRGIVWYGLLSVMAIRKEKHGHIGRPHLYNA